MAKNITDLPRGRALAAKLTFAALNALKENDGELYTKDVLKNIAERVELDDWAKERYEKSGYIRWQSILHFYSIWSVKAGFLVKKKGVWYLTNEGEKALKLGDVGLLDKAQEAYRKWKKERDEGDPDISKSGDTDDNEVQTDPSITLEQIQQLAMDGIKEFIAALNAYEFQDLVAALLRGMGYYTPFVAPRGKDGGVDILAYRDPFGIESPRIKVQVKHRKDTTATVKEVRELMGILQKDGDVGIFVSTAGYTPDAKTTAAGAHIHVQLIDLDDFINLWIDFYQKLKDEDRNLLPLTSVSLVAPTD